MAGKKTRLITKLDIKGVHLTKGIQYDGFRSLGDPAMYAEYYYGVGIDEIIIQDTVASLYEQKSLDALLERIASKIFIPLTVAGGINSLERAREIFRLGADKICLNTAAVKKINLINEIASDFGSQAVVASVDYYLHEDGRREIWSEFGRQTTGIFLEDWIKQIVKAGAGEIFLSCINKDGTGRGFDHKVLKIVQNITDIPLIISGGAGQLPHFDFLKNHEVNAICVSSMLHYDVALKHKEFFKSDIETYGKVELGNYDFISEGYGGLTVIPVKTDNILNIKNYISKLGFTLRNSKAESKV